MKNILFILIALCSFFSLRAGTAIDVEVLGKGKPVVILAGFGGKEPWKNSVQKLAASNAIYLVSIKGLNGEKNAAVSDFPLVEKEIIQYLEQNKILNPVLIGHSFGGFVAMHLAAQYSAMFKKLVIVDSYPFTLSIFNPTFNQDFGVQQASMLKIQLLQLNDDSYKAFWNQNAANFTVDSIWRTKISRNILDCERKNIAEAQAFVLSNDLRNSLSNIKCPTQVLSSTFTFKQADLTDDLIKQRIGDQFKNINNCNIIYNDQSRHFLMIDSPEWFITYLNLN